MEENGNGGTGAVLLGLSDFVVVSAGVVGGEVELLIETTPTVQPAERRRRTGFATGITDLTPGRPSRLLDVVPGRTGEVYADWLTERDDQWRTGVGFAALDPFRGYGTPRWPPRCPTRSGCSTPSTA